MVALYSDQYTSISGAAKYVTQVPINSTDILNYLVKIMLLLHYNRIGTCVTYLTDSDTTKNGGIGLIPIQMPELVQP